jgi:hypothetical protein
MTAAERAGVPVALLGLAALACTVVAFAALSAGGSIRYGTAAAGERNALWAGVVLGCLCGAALLIVTAQRELVIGRITAALAGFVAACAFAMPPAWALGAAVSTDLAESVGCGTITTPRVTQRPDLPNGEALAASCRDRLRTQKVVVAVLSAPSLGTVALSAAPLLRRRKDAEVV